MCKITKGLLRNSQAFFFLVFLGSCSNVANEPKMQFGKEVYHDGAIKGKGALINGKKTGLWIYYNTDSSVSSEYLYYNDSLNGMYIGYFEAGGDTLVIGNYVNGQEDGEWRSFYGNRLLAKKAYYKEGRKVGVWEYYNEDGRLFRKVLYDNGKEKILFEDE